MNNTNNKLFVVSVGGLFLLHWLSVQFYHYYCAPPGFYGLLKSVIASPSPLCISVNYLQFYSIKYYYSLWLSFSLSIDDWYWPIGGVDDPIMLLVLCAPAIAVTVFKQYGLYRAIIRYLGMKALFSVFKAVVIYAAAWGFLTFL